MKINEERVKEISESVILHGTSETARLYYPCLDLKSARKKVRKIARKNLPRPVDKMEGKNWKNLNFVDRR